MRKGCFSAARMFGAMDKMMHVSELIDEIMRDWRAFAMKLAVLYAGQGAQHAGMGKDLYEAFPAFRAVMDEGRRSCRF